MILHPTHAPDRCCRVCYGLNYLAAERDLETGDSVPGPEPLSYRSGPLPSLDRGPRRTLAALIFTADMAGDVWGAW